jgi:hypothetical protein
MAPPLGAQVGFLEGLDSIADEQFRQAVRKLEQRQAPARAKAEPASAPSTAAASATAAEPFALQPPDQAPAKAPARAKAAPAAQVADELLLRDATLEDIVRHLQAKNIEPTFRFLQP